GVSRKINRVLLLARSRYADVRSLIAEKLDGIDFVCGKAAILAIRVWALEIVSYHSPIAGVGRIHADLARAEVQSGDGDVVGRDINIRHARAVSNAGSTQRNCGSRISNKRDWIASRSAALN